MTAGGLSRDQTVATPDLHDYIGGCLRWSGVCVCVYEGVESGLSEYDWADGITD